MMTKIPIRNRRGPYHFFVKTKPRSYEEQGLSIRLFTVLYFSVRCSRSKALFYGLPSCISVKTTFGAGDGLGGSPIIPDARPLGTVENQDGRH